MAFTFPTTGHIKMSDIRSSLSKTGAFKISDFRTPLSKLTGAIKWSDLRGKTFGIVPVQYPNGFQVYHDFAGGSTNWTTKVSSQGGFTMTASGATSPNSPGGAMNSTGFWLSPTASGSLTYVPPTAIETNQYYVSQYQIANRVVSYATYDRPYSWDLQIYDLVTNSWKTIDSRRYTATTTPINNGSPVTFTCTYLGYPTRPSQFRLVVNNSTRYASISQWSMKMMPNPS